jgi:hypothetical protein
MAQNISRSIAMTTPMKSKFCRTVCRRGAGRCVSMVARCGGCFFRGVLGTVLLGLALAAGWGAHAVTEVIPIPNASFESPLTVYADPRIDSWQKTPKPFWYDESQGPWDQLTGSFKNPDPGSPDHIHNCDGDQAIWVFAVPEAGLFQDYETMDWDDPAPTHAFDARYEVGKSYQLTVGVIGGGGGMREGVSLQASLYYQDAASNRVTVAATNIVYSRAQFPDTTNFVEIELRLPAVQPSDPWAGQRLGIQFLSTVGFDLAGGYWDLDNVRLTAKAAALVEPAVLNGQFRFAIDSEPGLRFEILATTNPALPLAQWTPVGIVTNTSGSVWFTDPGPSPAGRLYRARQLP